MDLSVQACTVQRLTADTMKKKKKKKGKIFSPCDENS